MGGGGNWEMGWQGVKEKILLVYGRIFDFFRNDIYATLSEAEHKITRTSIWSVATHLMACEQ